MSKDEIRELQERRKDYEAAISRIDGVLKFLKAAQDLAKDAEVSKPTRRRIKTVDKPPAPENGSTGPQVSLGQLGERAEKLMPEGEIVAPAPAPKPNGKPKGGDAPTLIRALKAIQARTDLTANERSAESLKARVAFKKGQSYAPPPVRKREGAVLGEAG